jgi:hypothetical protein
MVPAAGIDHGLVTFATASAPGVESTLDVGAARRPRETPLWR